MANADATPGVRTAARTGPATTPATGMAVFDMPYKKIAAAMIAMESVLHSEII